MLNSSKPKRLLKDTRRVRPRRLIVFAYVLVAITVVGFVCLNEYVVSVQDQVRPGQSVPRVPQELIDMQGRDDALLNAQEPLDTIGTLYRIPIGRAMELIVEESAENRSEQ